MQRSEKAKVPEEAYPEVQRLRDPRMSEYILTHKHHTHPHAASGWRIHCGVEVTELSTNKQHTLSLQFCPKDELWEAAKAEALEMKILWKEANEESPLSEEQYQERFWRRRLDGVGLDTVKQRIPCHRIQTNARYEKQL